MTVPAFSSNVPPGARGFDAKSDAGWLRSELAAPWREIVLVLFVVIGISVVRSAWWAFHGSSSQYIGVLLTDRMMVRYFAIEGGLLALLFAFLHRRGWAVADFRIKPTWWSGAQGLLLSPFMLFVNSITVATGLIVAFACQTKYARFPAFVMSEGQQMSPHSIHFHWSIVIAAMVFNAFFEELVFMGYAFTQCAAKRGPLFALFMTVILRMSCHTYQGPVHMLGIGAAFLVAGIAYWRTRNLWPLIVAHALVDICSVSMVKVLHG